MIPHIHRRTFGTGPRPVLAIHCSLAHSGAWRGMGTALGDLVTLHAFDLPCHGKSGDWDGRGHVPDVACDMARVVLDDIGAESVDVIGHSFGAAIALRLALENPGRVRSLVLFEPIFFAPLIADDPGFKSAYAVSTAGFNAALDAGNWEEAARLFNANWGDSTAWEDIPIATRAYMTKRIGFIRASDALVLLDTPQLVASDQFARAQMPVLVLRGATSPMAAPVNTAIARRLAQATEIEVEGVGHTAPITHPEAVAAPVRDFLMRV